MNMQGGNNDGGFVPNQFSQGNPEGFVPNQGYNPDFFAFDEGADYGQE